MLMLAGVCMIKLCGIWSDINFASNKFSKYILLPCIFIYFVTIYAWQISASASSSVKFKFNN